MARAVCLLLALALCAAGLPSSTLEPTVLQLEASFGGAFSPRVALTFAPAVTAAGALHWKPNATTAGAVSEADAAGLAAAGGAAGGGHYRLRARHPSGVWVVGSVRTVRGAGCGSARAVLCLQKQALTTPFSPLSPPPHSPSSPLLRRQCVLAAADWVHDVVFTLDAAGAPRNIEVRPSVPAGFAGCSSSGSSSSGSSSSGSGKALPAVGAPYRTRFGVVSFDEVARPAEGAFRGVPYPGQKEISQVEVLTTQLSASGGVADEATKAALAAAAAKEAAEAEGKKSWWERLQGYAMPVAIFFMLQRLFDGGGKEKKEDKAAAAAAAK